MVQRNAEWSFFLTLLRWSADGLLWAWPVTAVLILGVVVGAWLAARQRPRPALFPMALQLALLSVSLCVLALGAWFQCEGCSPSALGQGVRHYTAMYVADAFILAQLAWAIWFVYRSAGRRVLATFVQAFLMWCTLWAGAMAGLSMSGDWL